ncbi:uncharacterized protein HD556DRAFT_623897 [Suillus plorans]|uniref:Uncharacterized protein n=1 Tax=Suillus plorans TaxID=116603 RepID=A0A9P7ALD9_9AGAM|nr:uncharacterized protein HD556DRAFT_623897 [Suillus plorans]KAG1791850.1 hypothetical protein HD556DRAFT_623897 [Suillus plorans]
MQLSVLFTALVSFVILAAASPVAPGAISKRSFKRENLDINFERHLPKTGLDDSDLRLGQRLQDIRRGEVLIR